MGTLSGISRPVTASAFLAKSQPVREAIAPDDGRGQLDRITTDAAVDANRRTTPKAMLEKRQGARFSIEEINRMDIESLTKRFNSLPKRENKSAAVHFLDLIDLPRNAVFNAVTSVAMPSARRAAIERGDFDDFGNPKVWGSDVVHGLGVDNGIVAGVLGFGIDLVGDPLSWIFAPLGGIKAVGAGGARVAVGRTGQKAYRRGLKQLAKGEEISDPIVNRLLNTASEVAAEKAKLGTQGATAATGATGADTARRAAGELLGDSGRLTDALGRVGLGQSGRGALAGRLGEQISDVAKGTAQGPLPRLESLQQSLDNSVNEFLAAFTFNRPASVAGIPLSAQTGRAVAHVPFTDITFYAPFPRNSGHQARLQRSIALGQSGKVVMAQQLWDVEQHNTAINRLGGELDDLLREQSAMTQARHRLNLVGADKAEVLETDGLIKGIADEIKLKGAEIDSEVGSYVARRAGAVGDDETRAAADRIAQQVARIDNIEDLEVTARSAREAQSSVALAKHQQAWQEVNGQLVERPTISPKRNDFAEARNVAQGIEEAVLQADRARAIDPLTAIDDLAPTIERQAEMDKMRTFLRGQQTERLQQIWRIADEDLDSAEVVANAYQKMVESATEVARIREMPLRNLLSSEDRLLAEGARRVLGEGSSAIGTMPFQSLSSAARSAGVGNDDSSAIASAIGGVENVGRSLARAFGAGVRGNQNEFNRVRAMYAQIIRGSDEFGAQFAKPYHDRLAQLAKAHNIDEPEQLSGLALALHVASKQDATDDIWMLSAPAQGTPSAAVRIVEEAQRSGLLKNKELMQELQNIADEAGEVWGRYSTEAAEAGQLGRVIPGGKYTPLRGTEEASRLIRAQADRFGKSGQGARASVAASAADAFQKPRGMWEIRYQTTPEQEGALFLKKAEDATRNDVVRKRFIETHGFDPADAEKFLEANPIEGRVRSYQEWQRSTYGSLGADDIDQLRLDAKSRSQLEEITDSIGLFNRIFPALAGKEAGDAIARTSGFGRAMDPFTINENFSNGLMQTITGNEAIGKELFETDITHLMASNMAETERARAKTEFLESALQFAVPFDRQVAGRIGAQTPGATAILPDGTQMTVMGDNTWQIGSRRYRFLKDDPFKDKVLDPLGNTSNSQIHGSLLPEEVATQIETFAEQLQPTRFKDVMKVANDFTRYWKINVLFHPSWAVVNTVGNAFLLGMAHRDFRRTPEHLKRAAQMAWSASDRSSLAGKTAELGGQTYDLADLMRVADANNITSGGRFAEALEQFVQGQGGRPLPDKRIGFGTGVGRRFKERHAKLLEDQLALAANAGDPKSLKSQQIKSGMGAMAGELGDGMKRMVNTWYRINGSVDDTFRLASLMMHLDEGNDMASAVELTKKALLNYGDFTRVENQVLRPLFPFYAWLKASFPNMTSKLFNEPEYFAIIPKIQEAMEEVFAGEEQLPRHLRPRWIQQHLGVQIGTDPATRKAFTIGTILPQEQTVATVGGLLGAAGGLIPGRQDFDGGDFMDALDFWYGQTSPPLKIITDLANKRQSFTGKTIGADLTEGDTTISEYLIGQIRWAREFGIGKVGPGPIQRAFGEGAGVGASRLAFGGRLQRLDEESRQFALQRELGERESRIRRAIRRAERFGDEEASREARANLLLEYERHMNAGGNPDDVPKWAKKMLAEFETTRPGPELIEPGE